MATLIFIYALAGGKNLQKEETTAVEEKEREISILKLNSAKTLAFAMIMFAEDNQKVLPTTVSELGPYLGAKSNADLSNLEIFEIVHQGSLKRVANPSFFLIAREKEASFLRGKWFKAYAFADGHAELTPMPPEGFEAWEKKRMPAAPDDK